MAGYPAGDLVHAEIGRQNRPFGQPSTAEFTKETMMAQAGLSSVFFPGGADLNFAGYRSTQKADDLSKETLGQLQSFGEPGVGPPFEHAASP